MMLTLEQLRALPVTRQMLDRVAEQIARENDALPVSIDEADEVYHFVLPELDPEAQSQLREKLEFLLNRDITFDVAHAADLRLIIDLYYTGNNSGIENCHFEFTYRCPKRWDSLRVTDDKNIRFCTECQKPVTFCRTKEQLETLAAQGECVAFFDDSYLKAFEGDVGDALMGMIIEAPP